MELAPYIWQTTLFILKGAVFTLQLYAVTIVLSIPLGLACALAKTSRYRALSVPVSAYTWIFRGTPLLLQLIFCYYGLAIIGISLPPFAAAAISFTINYAAYFTEIYRAGIESVDKGQYEAARALSMNYFQTMRRIIIPQVVRRTIPPTCNEAINLVKDSALVIVIGFGDILRAAREISNRDMTVLPYAVAAAVYLALTMVIVLVFRKIEKRYAVYE